TLYEQPPRLDGALVVGISQSGESPDVKAVVEEARRQGRPTIALTNEPASPLALAAEAVLPLEAGEERSVAATKTYLNSLGAIALLFTASTADAQARLELESMETAIAGLAARGARLLVIADDARALGAAETPLPLVPGVPEWLSPLVTVLPGQLVALRLAELRGEDVDRPHGLQKVT